MAVKDIDVTMSASDHRLYFLIQLVAHRLKKKADKALMEAGGLTTAQAAALSIIAKEGSVSQRELADQLSQRESAITTMAARLQNAGYITKQRSKTDSRIWQLKPTKTGLTALRKMKKPFNLINQVLDENLDAAETKRIANDLKKILGALKR